MINEREAAVVLSTVAADAPAVRSMVWAMGAQGALARMSESPELGAALTVDPAVLLERAAAAGTRFVMPGDLEYPAGLRELAVHDPSEAPVGLWVRGTGDLDELTQRAVAVTGSRSATPYRSPGLQTTCCTCPAPTRSRPVTDQASFTSLAGDWIALLTGVCVLAGIVWGAVIRAIKPLRDRLDEIHSITEGLAAERERVDDLNDRVAGLEDQLKKIDRRLEDLWNLVLTLIDPRCMRNDHRAPLEVEDDQRPG